MPQARKTFSIKHLIPTLCPTLLFSLLSCAWHPASAENWQSHTVNPFYLPYAPSAWRTDPLEDKTTQWQIQHMQANWFVEEDHGDEDLLIDGEVGLSTLSARVALSDDWSAGVTLPYVSHQRGIWDNLIYDWHEWFGLPQGGREEATNNQIAYVYEREAQTVYAQNQGSRGIGDVRLALYRSFPFRSADLLGQAELRLPTGSAEDLTGSGGYGLNLGLGLRHDRVVAGFETENRLAGGVTWNEKGDVALSDTLEPVVASLQASTRWSLTSWVALRLHLETHSRFYDSELEGLSGIPLQLLAGFDWTLSDNWAVQTHFSEDLNPSASPDFTATLAIVYHPGGD